MAVFAQQGMTSNCMALCDYFVNTLTAEDVVRVTAEGHRGQASTTPVHVRRAIPRAA